MVKLELCVFSHWDENLARVNIWWTTMHGLTARRKPMIHAAKDEPEGSLLVGGCDKNRNLGFKWENIQKRSSERTLFHDMVVVLSWFGPVLVLVSKNSVYMHLPPKGCVHCNTHISEEYINSTEYMLCLSHFTNINK